jgi:hypothetical protein
MRIVPFFLLSFGLAISIQAQSTGYQPLPYRMNIRIEGGVPHPVANRAFRKSFSGVYELGASYSIEILRGFTAGLAYKSILWKTPDNKIPGVNVYGQNHNFGFRISFDRRVSRNVFLYGAFTASRSLMRYTGVICRTSPANDPATLTNEYQYNIFEPQFGCYFFTEGNFAIGLQTGIGFTNYEFDPYRICLNQYRQYTPDDRKGNIAVFSIGIHLVYGFLKKNGAIDPLSE